MGEETMTEVLYNPKIKPEHLARKAIVYLRQSSGKQVRQNKESQLLQYAVAERVRALGWQKVEVINSDLGSSAGLAAAQREGFEHWGRSESSAAGRYHGYPEPTKTGVGCWKSARSLER
jgi:L-amino acid N-acyltransferase YncA